MHKRGVLEVFLETRLKAVDVMLILKVAEDTGAALIDLGKKEGHLAAKVCSQCFFNRDQLGIYLVGVGFAGLLEADVEPDFIGMRLGQDFPRNIKV